ncbi:hypothetical protein ZEAMMB73_Zm00001d007450 [Zea mays]|uniref:Uncharacterized protein n=1 Tax=Zea mays TaxID=4577 RepID=A0A1D6F6J2_MAIZE|nr:hypothetical protein ZEAMMB73_Zm00001d007450 [Zea mays]
MSKYYGESERLLGSIFYLANDLPERGNIFLDEVFNMLGKSIDADQRLTLDGDKLTTDLAGLFTRTSKSPAYHVYVMRSNRK